MTVDLDTRMRTARDALLDAADPLSPRRPTRPPRSLRPAAVVAVAVAAVLVVVGVAVRPDHHQDGLNTVISPPSTVPRLVPSHVPKGVPALGALDLPVPPLPGMDLGMASVSLYGDPHADDPFAEADLAVGVTAHDPAVDVQADERVTVRGRTGSIIDIDGPAKFISWQEQPGTVVLIGSHTLDRRQLLAAADALVVQGGRATLRSDAAGVPGRLAEVAAIPDFPLDGLLGGMAPMVRHAAKGSMVGNESDEYDHALVVVTATGDAPDIAAIRWITHADTPTRVRGHDGWTGVDPARRSDRVVVWQEAPGVIGVVMTTGVDKRELLDIAAGLHPATDQEWHTLRGGAGSGSAG